MLFSENKCFFKRQRPIPSTLEFIATTSKPFSDDAILDPDMLPSSSYERSHKRCLSIELTQPAKVYTAKHPATPVMLFPDPQPTWNQWSLSTTRTNTSSSPNSLKDHSAQSKRKPSFWTRRLNSGKRGLFRNAGLDDQGRLKSEYVEVGDTIDWGEPEEWLPRERRPRYQQ